MDGSICTYILSMFIKILILHVYLYMYLPIYLSIQMNTDRQINTGKYRQQNKKQTHTEWSLSIDDAKILTAKYIFAILNLPRLPERASAISTTACGAFAGA